MKQLPRAAEQALTLRTAEFLRRDGADEAVAGGVRMLPLDQLAAVGQRGTLRAQPGEHAPEGAVMKGREFVARGYGAGLLSIEDGQTLRADRLAIRTPVVFQVADGQMQQGWAGVALIREYESRGDR